MATLFPHSAENIVLFFDGRSTQPGTFTIIEAGLGAIACLKTPDANEENPCLSDPFLLNPLTDPFLEQGGWFLFSLNYYSDMTVIEDPPRICFHDATQEMGISVNMSTAEEFRSLFAKMREHLNITATGLPGFFKMNRPASLISGSYDFEVNKKSMKQKIENGLDDSDSDLAVLHRELINTISPRDTQMVLDPNEEQLNQAFESLDKLREYVKGHKVPKARSAEVWGMLIGIGDITKVPETFLSMSRVSKFQWKSKRYSQLKRSSKDVNSMKQLNGVINSFKQKLVTVVNDIAILQITFDLVMTVSQVYGFCQQNYAMLIYILRVLYSMFIKRIEKSADGSYSVVVNDRITLSGEHFEAIAFWSVIYIMEKGEIRTALTGENDAHLTQITDFLTAVDPFALRRLYQNSRTSARDPFDNMLLPVTTYLSSVLPLCDCINLWILAFSTRSPFEFLNCCIITCFIFSFTPSEDRDDLRAFIQIVTKTLQDLDIRQVMYITFNLYSKYRELFRQSLKHTAPRL